MKTWFITGTSRGFGREWTEAALKRGDKVAAAARHTDSLNDLVQQYGDSILLIELDVTDRLADFAAVKQAKDKFGTLDIVVNNAGYGQFGMIEELSEEEARKQIETNVFGALWITQAALPIFREQGHGHFLQVSSVGGVVSFPNTGIYHASKYALEGFSESMSKEVAPMGIKVTLIEPGGFSTDWSGSSAKRATPNPAYDEIRNAPRASAAGKPGDPAASSEAILKVVDSANPPLRLLLGDFAAEYAPKVYDERIKTWNEWKEVAKAADGN